MIVKYVIYYKWVFKEGIMNHTDHYLNGKPLAKLVLDCMRFLIGKLSAETTKASADSYIWILLPLIYLNPKIKIVKFALAKY